MTPLGWPRRLAVLGTWIPFCLYILVSSPLWGGDAAEVFVADDVYFVVWVVDPATGEAHRGFAVPDAAMGNTHPRGRSGLGYDAGQLFYTHSATDRIWALDAQTGAVLRVLDKPLLQISGLGAGGGRLYATRSAGRTGSVLRLDPASGAVEETWSRPGAGAALDVLASRGSLFLKVGDLELSELSLDGGAPERSFPLPAPLTELAACEGTSELFGVTAGGILHRIDLDTGASISSVQIVDTAGNVVSGTGGLAARPAALQPAAPPADPVELPAAELDIEDATIMAGDFTDVGVLLSSTGPTQGFQIAVVHDPGILALNAIATRDTATSENGADFTSSQLFPNGGTLAVIFDLFSPFLDNELPAGDNQLVAYLRYVCPSVDLVGSVQTEIRFVDGVLGSPPKDNLLVFQGRAVSPDLFPGRITCVPRVIPPGGPELFCGGEIQPDGTILPLFAKSGDRVKVRFYYTFEHPSDPLIQGLSMAVVFDCRMTCLEDTFAIPPESIISRLNADFVDFQCESDPNDGDGCEMVLGILVDSLPPFGNGMLPATRDPLVLACVDLEVGGGVELDECLDISFRDGINGSGKIPIKNLFSVHNESVPALGHPCTVCITQTGPSFFCGAGTLDDKGRPEVPIGKPGDEVEFCLWYNSPGEAVASLVQALRYDCHLQCIEGSFQPSADLAGAEFVRFSCENDSADGDPCEMVLEVVADTPGTPGGALLPAANMPRKLGCMRFKISSSAVKGECLPVEYHDSASGKPGEPHDNTVVTATGRVDPNTFDCKVCVLPVAPPAFYCGGATLGDDGLPVPITEVEPGHTAQVCLWYTSPVDELTTADEIQGLSMAICYDCNLKCIEDSFHLPPDSILVETQAEYVNFHCDNDPNDGDGCEMVLGVLVDYLPPFEGKTLPPTNQPLKLACVDMVVAPSAKPGFCLDLKFCDGINGRGKVPIKNLVSVNSVSIKPTFHDCAVCVKHLGPCFYCGGTELGRNGLPVIPQGRPGEPVDVCFWYCAPEDNATGHAQLDHIQGVSIAVSYDCRLKCKEDSLTLPPDSITAAMGAEYVALHCDNDPNDGDGCELVLAILIDALPPFDGRTLPPTSTPLKLACVKFCLPDDADCGECFDIKFQNGVNGRGKVPVFNQVSAENMSFLAITFDCKVCVSDVLDAVFIRGDCNFFDRRVDIADAAEVVSFLFAKGTWKPLPPCLDACDANDDGRLDLADAFSILHYLFLFGREPPPPGPHRPGPDPTPDKIDCKANPCP